MIPSEILQLVGNWIDGRENGETYPESVAEALGAMVDGNEFVIISGFVNGWNQCTDKTHSIDTQDQSAKWIEKDRLTADLSIANHDLSEGISHAGFVAVGSKIYVCGAVSNFCVFHPSIKNCVSMVDSLLSDTAAKTVPWWKPWAGN